MVFGAAAIDLERASLVWSYRVDEVDFQECLYVDECMGDNALPRKAQILLLPKADCPNAHRTMVGSSSRNRKVDLSGPIGFTERIGI